MNFSSLRSIALATAMLATLEMAVDGDFGPLSEDQGRLLSDAYQRVTDWHKRTPAL